MNTTLGEMLSSVDRDKLRNTVSAPTKDNNWSEVEVIRDPDGLIAVITENLATGHVSFQICKEFDRGGSVIRTTYANRRHVPGFRRLLERVEERLDIAEDRSRAKRRMKTQPAG